MSSTDPLTLERQVCFALTVASRGIVAAYKPVLDPLGITHPQYLVMLALWEHRTLDLSTLARLLHQEASTLSPLIKRLEAQGLAKRQRSIADERRLEITLTPEGEALRTRAEQVPIQMAARLKMTPAELGELHASMVTLIEASQNSLEDHD
ncbi:MarR family winged helix-turn-helix transcriptional regulator [Leucobacter luti]|uniref:DNA-binding MarR family transcriptional regulator n=1 Tax=Leucobacter luti TaxID=340320 RepID=A0A4R6S3X0_9MICO|nr:MarR family transcriptional regulator [Leucobacter luti]QYM76756.1 MarR family transcriptional regulator [Leucobacter luti]TDP94352.1 DNA-binding MarR family transcriptional regulator [Leucobacter luti]